jgi:4a-hydroxytetrahydrobiopterin dehydratase
MAALADQACGDCQSDDPPFGPEEVRRFLREVDGWEAVDDHHLRKRWRTGDFARALALVVRFGEIAEEQGHHPELTFGWGHVEARIWTHGIDGLALADFVLAARYDRAARALLG